LTGGDGFVPEAQEVGGPRPSIGFGLAEDTPFEGQHLIGTQARAHRGLVLTLAGLEFGQRIDHVTRADAPSSLPSRNGSRPRRFGPGDIEGQAGGFEHSRPRFGAGGEDKSGHNITLFWAFLLIGRERKTEKPAVMPTAVDARLRFTTFARFRRGFPPGIESSPPPFGNGRFDRMLSDFPTDFLLAVITR
jgi:hypothetical protein